MVSQKNKSVGAELARQRAQQALSTSRIHALRQLVVESKADAVRIHGRVSSFYHKQLAQEAVLAVAEGTVVVNDVSVH